jgi:hypothetical protein
VEQEKKTIKLISVERSGNSMDGEEDTIHNDVEASIPVQDSGLGLSIDGEDWHPMLLVDVLASAPVWDEHGNRPPLPVQNE